MNNLFVHSKINRHLYKKWVFVWLYSVHTFTSLFMQSHNGLHRWFMTSEFTLSCDKYIGALLPPLPLSRAVLKK